jgi:hypothetical protein
MKIYNYQRLKQQTKKRDGQPQIWPVQGRSPRTIYDLETDSMRAVISRQIVPIIRKLGERPGIKMDEERSGQN